MANPSTRRHADRHGRDVPTVPVSAMCETGRCARCRGEVLSLLHPVGTRCGCGCHGQQLPPAWAEQVATFPPCELDGGEAA